MGHPQPVERLPAGATMPGVAARLSDPVRRAVIDGGIVAGLLFFAYLFLVIAPAAGTFGFDAYAYWAVDPADPYAATAGALGAFTYSPVIAGLFAPFGLLPFWQFLWLWTAVLVGTAIWLGGRPVRPSSPCSRSPRSPSSCTTATSTS